MAKSKSTPAKISFQISGMHCASCATNSTRVLKKTPGVIAADVSYATGTANLEVDQDHFHFKDAQKSVANLGYQAYLEEDEMSSTSHDHMHHKSIIGLKHKLILSFLLTIPLMLAMIPGMPMWLMDPRLQLLLATPVQFYVGWQYYVSAYKAAKNGLTNMDTLITLGTSVAYFFSLAVVIFGSEFEQLGIETHVYFETSAAIITLIMLGKYLEERAKGQTSKAIQKLLNLQAKKARVIRDGKEIEIPVDEVNEGDIIKVKPGEKIPVDGIIQKGNAAIDESMVTGESLPVSKTKGDLVIGSTINTNGSLFIETTAVGKNTFLAHVIELVRAAQSSKAPIQKLVDKVSSIFVPVVIALAITAFIIWFVFGPEPQFIHALLAMIAVLIIACPCALGLATPTSIMVAVGRGAKEGILIKDAQHLEIAGKIDTIIFDKTGTLTQGKPTLQKATFIDNYESVEEAEIYLKSIEQESHHPLAQAVVKGLSNVDSYPVKKFKDVAGMGIQGEVDGKLIHVGTETFFEKYSIPIPKELKRAASSYRTNGQTVSFVAINQQAISVISIADQIKKQSKKAIEKLHQLHIKTVMLTGDNQKTANAVAKQLGIDEVKAQVLPQDKQAVVNLLKESGRVVAMVGDGINDAPALAAADIGIAMGLGTDVAIETAGITLLRSDISLAPKAIQLSRTTLANIKQNLFWAFGYNTVLIPVAMGALYPFYQIQLNPIIAAAAMALSSVSVVTNALRVRNVKL